MSCIQIPKHKTGWIIVIRFGISLSLSATNHIDVQSIQSPVLRPLRIYVSCILDTFVNRFVRYQISCIQQRIAGSQIESKSQVSICIYIHPFDSHFIDVVTLAHFIIITVLCSFFIAQSTVINHIRHIIYKSRCWYRKTGMSIFQIQWEILAFFRFQFQISDSIAIGSLCQIRSVNFRKSRRAETCCKRQSATETTLPIHNRSCRSEMIFKCFIINVTQSHYCLQRFGNRPLILCI